MNDPILGLVIGLISMFFLFTGYRMGHRCGHYQALEEKRAVKHKAHTNGEPKVAASWLRRNVFKPGVLPKPDDQKTLWEAPAPRIRIL